MQAGPRRITHPANRTISSGCGGGLVGAWRVLTRHPDLVFLHRATTCRPALGQGPWRRGRWCGTPSQCPTAESLDSGTSAFTIFSSFGGNSSAGRAQPCQGWGREFESRFPLQAPHRSALAYQRRSVVRAEWQSGHAAACKAVYAGSIPTSASTSSTSFTFMRCLSILPVRIARVAELADAADSSGSPTWKRVGAQGSNSGNP